MPRDTDGWGKTDDPRPCLVSREEKNLRWRLAFEKLSLEEHADIERRIKALEFERLFHG